MTPLQESYDEITYAPTVSFGQNSYFISSDGRLYRVREIKPSINKKRKGYMIAATFDAEGKKTYRTIHSIVAGSFIGPRPKGMTINHIDGDKYNNSASNLEYMTVRENVLHAHRIGLCKKQNEDFYQKIPRRTTCPEFRKVDDDTAILMIRAYRDTGKSIPEIAKEFQLHKKTAWNVIRHKKCYRDIKIREGVL